MSEREIPAALRRTGLTSIQHELPDGFEVDFHADFYRIFKDDIARREQRQAAAEAEIGKNGGR